MMEILDVVDENDEVIDTISREDLIGRDVIHRAVAVLIVNSDGKVLIQKRSQGKTLNPGIWSQLAGHVISEETYDLAAKRETAEELFCGVMPELKLEKLFKILINSYVGRAFFTVFRCEYDGHFTANPEEVERIEFRPVNDILADIEANPKNYSHTIPIILKRYKEYLSSKNSLSFSDYQNKDYQ